MCLKMVEQEAGGSVRQTTRSMTGGARARRNRHERQERSPESRPEPEGASEPANHIRDAGAVLCTPLPAL